MQTVSEVRILPLSAIFAGLRIIIGDKSTLVYAFQTTSTGLPDRRWWRRGFRFLDLDFIKERNPDGKPANEKTAPNPPGSRSVKLAYLFFAYRNPRLIGRIIERLSCDEAAFFIHIDQKSDLDEFASLRRPNVYFTTERHLVYWAEFSGVSAILTLMGQALAHPTQFDYLVLLSGSEYPLHAKEYIHRFFAEHRGREFISLVKMPNVAAGKPLSRIETLRFPTSRPLLHFLSKVLSKVGLARRDHRKYLGGLAPYAGHTWWALSQQACHYVLQCHDRQPQLANFFANTFAPEETFIHTILGNSEFYTRTQRNLLFEDWSASGSRPEMINEKHIALFEKQDKTTLKDPYGEGECLFARKFSDDTLGLVDKIDRLIDRQSI